MSGWDPYPPLQELIAAILSVHPRTAVAVRRVIARAAEYDPGNAVYTALARLARQGCVIQEGYVYRLTRKGQARLAAGEAVRSRVIWAGEGGRER